MLKRINCVVTVICFFALLIGAAGVDAENAAPAIVLMAAGIIGIFAEGFYWRRIYD